MNWRRVPIPLFIAQLALARFFLRRAQGVGEEVEGRLSKRRNTGGGCPSDCRRSTRRYKVTAFASEAERSSVVRYRQSGIEIGGELDCRELSVNTGLQVKLGNVILRSDFGGLWRAVHVACNLISMKAQ